MDDNVMRVLQLLQDGKISAQEAESLISALTRPVAAKDEGGRMKDELDAHSSLITHHYPPSQPSSELCTGRAGIRT